MTKQITASIDVLEEVDKHLSSGQKIKAIKHLREHGRYLSYPEEMPTSIGLRDAKLAIDSLTSGTIGEVMIVPEWRVHTIVVSGPAGSKIEVDLEKLQMHFLTSLPVVGLREAGRLLDLVDYIKRWQGDAPATKRNDNDKDATGDA